MHNSTAGVGTAAAPTLGDASLSVAEQIHLSNTSAIFKNDVPFLWDDTSDNLALGRHALELATGIADENTAIGTDALRQNTAGSANAALGTIALYSNGTGSFNTGIGWGALFDSTTGSSNTAIGHAALFYSTTGYSNTAVGSAALVFNTTGTDNIAIGQFAGSAAPPDASDNIFIGSFSDASDTAHTIRIGEEGTQIRAFLAGVDGAAVSGSQVLVTPAGQLGVSSSSRRFKEAIRPLEGVSEEVLALEPVTFRYKPELVAGGGEPQVGLIAEEVAKLFPELVTRDEEGRPFGVRYDLLSVVLLEEVQKLHAELVDLRRRLAAVEAGKPPRPPIP